MKLLILIVFLLFTVNPRGQSQEVYNLNGTWKFAFAKTKKEADRLDKFYLYQFADEKFQPIPVPSNWAILGFEEPVYGGFQGQEASEGFYIREFSLPTNWENKRVLLHFGGVWSSAEVWLNGKHLGRHDSGYTSFSFDITNALNVSETNKLAVRVRQDTREYKCDVYDDWTLGGIYRDVTLEAMPRERWIDYVNVQTVFDSQFKNADLKIHTMIADVFPTTLPGNYMSSGNPYKLLITLFDKEGNKVADRELTIPSHTATGREIALTLHVNTPYHWTAETPYLYSLQVKLIEDNNKVTHSRTEKIGFRQISTEGGILKINGQAVKLRGINRHDEHPDVGRATTREQWLQDLKLMKEANINYVRTAHYAPAKGFIELCDEIGMYVGEEVSIGGGFRGVADPYRMYDPSYSNAIFTRSCETVVRDRNNPSVIYWSIGNEDPFTTLHLASIKIVKAFDTSRPVLIPWRFENWLPDEVDMLSAHYWQPLEYDQWAAQANRPVITTEYTHSNGITGTGGLEMRWKTLIQHPSGAGGAIWMWADQGLKTSKPNKIYEPYGEDKYLRVDRRRGWDGIVDSYRNITRDYLEVKAVYAPVFPAIEKLSFINGQDSLYIPIKNEFDFTNLNQVDISWSLWCDEQKLQSGNKTIDGIPHATSIFTIPAKYLSVMQSGKNYYVWLVFTSANGTKIGRNSVEIVPYMKPETSIPDACKVSIKEEKEQILIQVGKTAYLFNSQTGHLSAATFNGKTLITDLRPTIWHELDYCEAALLRGKNISNPVDLNQYAISVNSWEVNEYADKVEILAKVEYLVDNKNKFDVVYSYSITSDAKLYVHYEIMPDVEMPWLPIAGMSLESPQELSQIRWLGLGPYDAYPNKKSACILGVWKGMSDNDEVIGNKATRWIEKSGDLGRIRIYNNGYMEHRKEKPEVINILSYVLDRPEGGRKADTNILQPQAEEGEKYIGEFYIMLF